MGLEIVALRTRQPGQVGGRPMKTKPKVGNKMADRHYQGALIQQIQVVHPVELGRPNTNSGGGRLRAPPVEKQSG